MEYQKGDIVDGYKVLMLIKTGAKSNTYRVKGADGLLYALKTGVQPAEIMAVRRGSIYVTHTSGYIVTRYVSGETVEQRVGRGGAIEPTEAVRLVEDVLEQLELLHSADIAHGGVHADNVMIDMGRTPPPAVLVGMGSAARLDADGLAADLREVGLLLYYMLFGTPGEVPLKLPAGNVQGLQPHVLDTVYNSVSGAFADASAMLKALRGETTVQRVSCPAGGGFDDVAGMDDIKRRLQEDVIDILAAREEAERYGITIPNGMLLYGPPGCGKTFIAEKFAEQAGYNYRYIRSSDLASTYIHGTQEMIGRLFNEARANAPTILCFDEFDALVPVRDEKIYALQSGEVNEFLSQLNNCGRDGVFVIASTNRPDRIDPAVLRTGRIDHILYVPLPDAKAREALFGISLKNRPVADDIDLKVLSALTGGYIASDIITIVQECARRAFKTHSTITMGMLREGIAERRPSLTPEVIRSYEQLRERMESGTTGRRTPRIGFT